MFRTRLTRVRSRPSRWISSLFREDGRRGRSVRLSSRERGTHTRADTCQRTTALFDPSVGLLRGNAAGLRVP